jgi:serine/threonine protein kinase/cytochrome c-type biogenesis protein CcmH/NrfG
MIGQTLGHYRIEAKLGQGGMGEVYRAHDTVLDRVVALKVLPADKVRPDSLHRFLREARAASKINHPNVVAIYEIAESSGVHFIVMEYVPGKALSDLIPPKGFPTDRVVDYARQIAASLAKAHASGVIHRDLKPANIMVTAEGTIKVLDFGLAKLHEAEDAADDAVTAAETQSGVILGTAPYMSPEQLTGRLIDARSDIFSLGLVLYELASGRGAFREETPMATMAAILHKEPLPLRELLPQLPRDLDRVVTRCIRKDPNQRFQSAVDLRLALEDVQMQPGLDITPSIAVMPFTNLSSDKDNEYFSDGLAEEIISALSLVPGLRVSARSSAFSFRGKDVEMAEIGRKLGVEHVLEGSVRKAGNRIRVTVQLVKAADSFQVWSGRFDREITDVFAVQDEIAETIVERLKGKLSTRPMASSRDRHSHNLESYNAYLMGRHYLWRIDSASLGRARECFEKAIALDSAYALAYAGIATCLFMLSTLGVASSTESLAEAKRLLEKALELDSTLAEVRVLLGAVRVGLEYDLIGAEREFQQALTADTVSADCLDTYGRWVLWPQGRFEEALAAYERAHKLEPLIPTFVYHSAEVFFCRGEFEKSIEQCIKALEIENHFWMAHMLIGWSFVFLEKPDEALNAFDKAEQLEPQSPIVTSGRVAAHALAGRMETAQEISGQGNVISAYSQALRKLYLGETDRMFELLHQAADQRDATLFWFPNIVAFRHKFEHDPRYHSLLRKMNLAPR